MNTMHCILSRGSSIIHCFTEWFGRTLSWLVLVLTLLVVYDVTMRYVFNSGSIALQEMEWHLFSVIIFLSMAYAQKHNAHVRMDIIYRSRWLSPRMRLWIDMFGTVCLLLPFSVLIIISAWPFVSQAYIHAEGSPDPGGLPLRWIIKACIPLGFLLLILQGVAEFTDKLTTIQNTSATAKHPDKT